MSTHKIARPCAVCQRPAYGLLCRDCYRVECAKATSRSAAWQRDRYREYQELREHFGEPYRRNDWQGHLRELRRKAEIEPDRRFGVDEPLTAELGKDLRWHARYPTATRTLCLAEVTGEFGTELPDCGVCAKTARTDGFRRSMPWQWNVEAAA